MRPHAPLQNRHGHTLIEMVTVMVLILVMVSLIGPSMNGYMTRNRTRRALDRVANDISLARMNAVRSGRPAVLDMSAGNSYFVQLQTATPSAKRSVLLNRDFPGVTLTSPSPDGKLVFDSRGMMISPSSGTIVASAGGISDSTLITAAGRVYRAY